MTVAGTGPVGENAADRTRAADLGTLAMEREPLGRDSPFRAREPGKSPPRPVRACTDAPA
ncbi:hypothetical protein [Streptomyces sp. NPDC001083]|uniref:hypothetical protein n=1 Tax=Streptomyces sp. NPDC001083 TaxID=3364545 RepID=UPI00367D8666